MIKPGHLLSSLYANYMRNASKRSIAFLISREDFFVIISQDCYICGSPPANRRNHAPSGRFVLYNGLDRVNNQKGYTPCNVKPCCWRCNVVKGTMEIGELKSHLAKMIDGLKGA